jgi:hypothetical protein
VAVALHRDQTMRMADLSTSIAMEAKTASGNAAIFAATDVNARPPPSESVLEKSELRCQGDVRALQLRVKERKIRLDPTAVACRPRRRRNARHHFGVRHRHQNRGIELRSRDLGNVLGHHPFWRSPKPPRFVRGTAAPRTSGGSILVLFACALVGIDPLRPKTVEGIP